jgi:hypothetical protein
VILITTGENQLSETILTEVGQLTVLGYILACKYDECVRSFHALFLIYKLTYLVLFPPFIALNSPTTPLSFIATLCLFCDSY